VAQKPVRISRSAFKHGAIRAEIEHAFDDRVVLADLDPDSDPPKVLVIGADLAGNLLEVLLVVGNDDEDLTVIHAMKPRPIFYPLLPAEGGMAP
jgi:hypothetical protein